MPRVWNRPYGSDRDCAPCASVRTVTAAGFLMSDRWRETGSPQTAFLQAEGKLRLQPRSQPRNAPDLPTQPDLLSADGDTKPSSGPLLHQTWPASRNSKTIQSP